tara:strand:- start:16 stop:1065 length:1050 start_codon:yes stop_codon:yes gene_type:complete
MAYTTINKSTANFNTITWTGNASARSLTGVGHAPDLVWIKDRSEANGHALFDKVRGVNKYITTNQNIAELDQPSSGYVSAFDSDGWSAVTGSSGYNNWNKSSNNYVAWNWKAGTAVSGNTTGSGSYKSYTGSVNTTSGFSIIKYTGNGTSGHTIPHHLGAVPEWILVKDLDAAVNWQMYHVSLGNTYTTEINITNAPFQSSSRWNNTTPSSTVVTLGNGNNVNNNNTNYIMYAFTSKTGYSKFGSYVGNDNNDGTFIYTGFKPTFVLIKKTNEAKNSFLHDDKRLGYNPSNSYVNGNLDAVEYAATDLDIVSNGIKMRSTGGGHNDGNYIYVAFGQSIVGSNNIPATAR